MNLCMRKPKACSFMQQKQDGSWKAAHAEPIQGDSCTISGLNPGSAYIVRVTAINSESQGTPSEGSEIVKFEDVRELPSFVNKPGDTVVVKGTKVKVAVEFSGFPLPEVRWMRNRKEIFSGARQWTETFADVSSFSIAEIRDEDEGEYT
ncbi:immunoglobulin I-set domain protein [Ostertagia ostertagi]